MWRNLTAHEILELYWFISLQIGYTYTRQHMRTNVGVYGEVYGNLAKTNALSSSSLLPMLRGISGTA